MESIKLICKINNGNLRKKNQFVKNMLYGTRGSIQEMQIILRTRISLR